MSEHSEKEAQLNLTESPELTSTSEAGETTPKSESSIPDAPDSAVEAELGHSIKVLDGEKLESSQTGMLTGDYEILEELGSGSGGSVFKARQTKLDRVHAVKVLHKKLLSDPSSVKRFKQEADIAASLDHPNVVAVYGHGNTNEGAPFIAMDYVEGLSLSELLASEGALQERRAIDLFIQIADGLSHAHQSGLVHRDLKPSNILISSTEGGTERASIVDFGIAKVLTAGSDTLSTLTANAEFLGTPHYMSPEQCLGQTIDVRTDIYSLGCMLYQCLDGRLPFAGAGTVEVIAKKIGETPTNLTSDKISEPLLVVIECATSRKPQDRYNTVEELKEDLRSIANGKAPIIAKDRIGTNIRTFWKRVGALMIDIFAVQVVNGLLGIFLLLFMGFLSMMSRNSGGDTLLGLAMLFSYFGLPLIIYFLYFVYSEVTFGATPGKQIMKLRVCDAKGEKLTWGRAIMRNLMKLVVLGSTFFFAIGLVVCAVSQRTDREMPWDIATGCRVRRRV